MDAPAPDNFADTLAAAIDRVNSPCCVGLDPVLERVPESVRAQQVSPTDAIMAFCLGVIKACEGVIAIIKPQSACFERYGARGAGVLHEVIGAARSAGMVVILDAKRGDIGVTAEHYAAAAFEGDAPADAITLSGYLGPDTVAPYLMGGSRGVFILVRTSNPGSDAVQSCALADGRTVAQMMADHVANLGAPLRGRCGLSSVGAVVAATKPADGAALRTRMPDQFFLIPGYGAQGGRAEDIRPLLRPGRTSAPSSAGIVVTASRSVIYAGGAGNPQWQSEVARAAMALAAEVRGVADGG